MAAECGQVYKCEHCGIIAVVVHAGGGEMVCCGESMALYEAKTADAATEKHVPVIEKIEGGVKVTVGSTLHPMDEDHYIEWIEICADGQCLIQPLKPGDAPEAVFKTDAAEICCAREWCNKHGLWKTA